MRTAEEILNDLFMSPRYSMADHITVSIAIESISQARKEAIEECAEVATANSKGRHAHPYVEKQSILNLINQIK